MSEPRSTGLDVQQVVRAVLAMMASGAPDGLNLLTDDVDVRSPLGDVEGREQLRAGLSDWRDGMTNAKAVVERVHVSGCSATVTWRLLAHHTGVILVNEDMLFEPTGAHIDLPITTELDFAGSLVAAVRHDYSLHDLLVQIGIR